MPKLSTAEVGSSRINLSGTGADLAARTLKALGVTHVFALCGDHINTLFHALRLHGIQIIGTRHESGAVQMADGWARASGKPGVAIVTGGPGHTNAVTGMAVAQGAYSPVILISGQASATRRERGGNQTLYQAELMRPVTKWATEAVSPDCLGEFLVRAFHVATSDTPGPVSVSIPVDVADATLQSGATELPAIATTFFPDRIAGADIPEDDPRLEHAADLLAQASRPVIVIGGNAWFHGSRESLSDSIRQLQIPTFTSGQARGIVADDGESCFGYANPLFNSVFEEAAAADAFLLVGAGVDHHFGSEKRRLINPQARVIQIHRDPRQIGVGKIPSLSLAASHAATLQSLARILRNKPATAPDAWREHIRRKYAEQKGYWTSLARWTDVTDHSLHPVQLCSSLRRHWSHDVSIVVDVGDFANWPKAYFPAVLPGQFMDGGALGNLGGSVPLAIGSCFAQRNSPVWTFVGDGGFGYHAWELSTAVEHHLPLKIIVGNDRAWGTEKRLQRKTFNADIGCDLPHIRYDRFAELVGAKGFHVGHAIDLDTVVDEFINASGPCVLNVELAQQTGRPFADAKTVGRQP
jgi:acetolactate synthase-1/2/3 large subunit